jgi:hypothetical protein
MPVAAQVAARGGQLGDGVDRGRPSWSAPEWLSNASSTRHDPPILWTLPATGFSRNADQNEQLANPA